MKTSNFTKRYHWVFNTKPSGIPILSGIALESHLRRLISSKRGKPKTNMDEIQMVEYQEITFGDILELDVFNIARPRRGNPAVITLK